MSTGVVSKNLYELLGNTHDEDSDREPEPPVKVVDKTPARTIKRNATGEAPASKAVPGAETRGPRRGGNDAAFRDRNAGRSSNQGKPVGDEATRSDRPPRHDRAQGTYEGRGGARGGRGGRGGYDRHSGGLGSNSEKQAAHGWGATDGNGELNDEKAGEALAKVEEKDALVNDAEGAAAEPAAEAEPEDNSKSYVEYLAELAEKKLALGAPIPEARKPGQGDKKWANAKALAKEDEEDFVAASAVKAKRERERKQKQTIDIDQRFVEAPEQRGGARGGFRGGRGRGDAPSRGGRGDGNFRGRGDRGDRGDRGGRGRGDGNFRGRGGPRGNSGGAAHINPGDTSAFPSLGA